MFNSITLISILEVILLMLPTLLTVAYVTVAERKTMASMQSYTTGRLKDSLKQAFFNSKVAKFRVKCKAITTKSLSR